MRRRGRSIPARMAQVGGAFGHLQSFTAFDSDLHLYQNLVH
ncbi:MAG: hypothetical protein ACREK8_05065 [Gemmatimonadales bacterium]